MMGPDLIQILSAMEKKGYRLFTNPRGHDLNLVGVRSPSVEGDRFDDWICVFYLLGTEWIFFAFPATTDPGTYYRREPMSVHGTAVVKPGQYRGVFKLGRHRDYLALQQQKPFTVYRDANRDTRLDTTNQEEETGLFGINLHRASATGLSKQIGHWSAGCQVIQDPDHFDFLLRLCTRQNEKYGGNAFTYTLLDERDLMRRVDALDAYGGL